MTLDELKVEIQACEAKGDYRGLVSLRAKIARDYPDTKEAGEALFRLGLYFLFAENQLDAAEETFKAAIQNKDAYWSEAARVSLASLYLRADKPQQAILELRKVTNQPTAALVNQLAAWSILELIYHNQQAFAELAVAQKAVQELQTKLSL